MHVPLVSARSRTSRPVRRLAVGAAVGLLSAGLLGVQAGGAQASVTSTGAVSSAAVPTIAPHAGTGTASTAHAVNVRQAAAAPHAAPTALNPAQQALLARVAAARPALPSVPTTGSKPMPAGAKASAANHVAHAAAPAVVRPQVAPPLLANFAGINLALSGCGCQPPDPNAAVGANEIVEMVNLRMEVYNKAGAALCGIGLNAFLNNTADRLSDPRVMYDNVNGRYLGVLTVVPASNAAVPALWVFATQANNPCGGWWIYRLTFAGGSFPAGTLLDYPILGQDRNAMLLATSNFTPSSGENFTVFGIPKSALYAGAGFSFGAFNTASSTAPVTNGGIPMISTSLSYFLGSVPGTGYRLYTLTNSGGAGAVLALKATISSTFSAPSRRVNQPGTTATLDPLDGRIQWSPVNDGSFIWFAHGINLGGFPSVRYGAISIAANTATVAVAYRSGTSDDFNPSVGVGNSPAGGNYIYLNWAYTDSPNNVATSDTVDSVNPGGGVPNLIGTGVVLVNGAVTGEFRFGDYSSVAIDPTNANGSCAVTAQQYFQSDGTWTTRIARVGTC